jgi:Fe-S cluster biogenesis protein NfuA
MEKYDREQLYAHNLITIYTESSPNPNSMKFMLNFMLISDGVSFDFPDKSSAENSPLAQELFDFEYIDRVFLMNNFITLTKKGSQDWYEIIPELKAFIKSYFEQKKPIFNENQKDTIVEVNENPDVAKIKDILEQYIKPAVEMDGGAIKFGSFEPESGLLKVLLQGSCSGCPSSTLTLKSGIENLMRQMVPSVKIVEAQSL